MSIGRTGQLTEGVAERIREKLYLPLIAKDELLKTTYHPEDYIKNRPVYQRDYTRILYSSAFRRLQGKMQLLGINQTNFYRNRLTHSLEVCQIARSIADDIGYSIDDLYVIEACCLAHDIGNTPFGHHGEKILNAIIDEEKKNDKKNNEPELEHLEGFEGNAQTLRVLNQLQAKSTTFKGMNLSYRTLLGVTKYFNRYSDNNKKYIYHEDYKLLDKFVSNNNIPLRTLDVQIMDIADEIAYAAHDLEDTLRNKLFTIDEFIHEFRYSKKLAEDFNSEDINNATNCLIEIVNSVKKKLDKTYTEQYYSIFCKEIGSKIIFDLIKDIDLLPNIDNFKIGYKTKTALSLGLKNVTFECVSKTNFVKTYEKKGEIIIRGLFKFYYDNLDFLPVEYRKNIDTTKKSDVIRTIIDYISGMMDSYAEDSFKKIYGVDYLETFGLRKEGLINE